MQNLLRQAAKHCTGSIGNVTKQLRQLSCCKLRREISSSLDPARLECSYRISNKSLEGGRKIWAFKINRRKLQKHLLSKQSNDSVATYGDMAFSPTKRAKFPPRTGNNSWMLQKATKLWSRDSSVARALDWRSNGPWFYPGSRQVQFLSEHFF